MIIAQQQMEHCGDLISDSANYDLGRHNNIYYLKHVVQTNCKSLIESQSKTKDTSQILGCQSQLNSLFIEYMELVMKSDEVFSSAVLRPKMLQLAYTAADAGDARAATTTTAFHDYLVIGSTAAVALAYFAFCACKK